MAEVIGTAIAFKLLFGLPLLAGAVITTLYGESGTARLLVASQVILSMQLPFAVIPLVRFVTDREKMGSFVVSRKVGWLAWGVATVIVGLNVKLLSDVAFGG